MSLIELITVIQAPQRRCFDLARSIDLHKMSTAGTKEEAVSGVTSGLIGPGEQVTWRATHFGFRQHLTSVITEFNYPHHFRDEMIQGVFRKIVHDHDFERHNDVTWMKDRFYFESPGGILGTVFNKIVLTSYLRHLLEKRNAVIKSVAESDQWKIFINEKL
jgi:ligand-binding SRPBCC domain-containing protein